MVCIGIVGAMDQEVNCLIQEMKDVEEKTFSGMTCHRGVLWDIDTVVVKSGVGKVNIADATTIQNYIAEIIDRLGRS